MSVKELALEVIREMPEGVTWDELLSELEILADLRRADAKIDAGDFVEHEDVKREIATWFSENLALREATAPDLRRSPRRPVLLPADLNLARQRLWDMRQEDFQDAVVELRGDVLVIDVVAQDERPQEVAFVILLMHQFGAIRNCWGRAPEERQLVVLHLQEGSQVCGAGLRSGSFSPSRPRRSS